MLDKTRIIIRPIITEKTEQLKTDCNQYTFEVARRSNKVEIKKAMEKLFNIHVDKVRVMNYDGKPKRMGAFAGKRSNWRKAVITLKKGEKIESLER
jgi:large subunit ribosomal protein L23